VCNRADLFCALSSLSFSPYGLRLMTLRDQTASIAFSLGLVAALLALCLRLMAPVGWMPVVSGNGVMFTLCSGVGTQQMVAGKEAAPSSPDTTVDAGSCAFAGMGTPPLPDVPADVARAIFAVFIALGLAATQRPRLAAIAWLRPPLRGPPLRA
jgi:hypothetical protein